MTRPRKARRPVVAKPKANAIDLKILERTLERMAKEFAEEASRLQAERIAREFGQGEWEEWR